MNPIIKKTAMKTLEVKPTLHSKLIKAAKIRKMKLKLLVEEFLLQGLKDGKKEDK